MSDRFKNKFRNGTARMVQWYYGWAASYFITVCTVGRRPFFGQITNDGMILSDLARILSDEWKRTSGVRPDMNLTLGEFVIMPDHFHGIISIGRNQYNKPSRKTAVHSCRFAMHGKPTTINKFGPQSKNLGSIMRGIKSAVTKQVRQIEPNFAWQPRFYDTIIRNKMEYYHISKYIVS
jgi:putative transposase